MAEADEKIVIQAEPLQDWATRGFAALGLPQTDAALIGAALVDSDLRGLGSHGVGRIPLYAERLRQGLVKAQPTLALTRATPVAALLDGDGAMGFVVGDRAMAEAVAMAEGFGLGMVLAKHSSHFGTASLYARQAMRAGFVGLVCTNASPSMPAWGGRTPFLGTNPMSLGAPGGKEQPFLLDFATSVTARGKIRLAARRGVPIEPGLALDAEGNPTTDAQKAYDGVILPFGGHKGSGIAMMIDILAGVLSGSAFAGEVKSAYEDFSAPQNVGHFFLAIKPDLFMSRSEYQARMDELTTKVKAQPKAAGVEEIMMPGEPEDRLEAKRRKEGIPFPQSEIKLLVAEGMKLGVAFPTNR